LFGSDFIDLHSTLEARANSNPYHKKTWRLQEQQFKDSEIFLNVNLTKQSVTSAKYALDKESSLLFKSLPKNAWPKHKENCIIKKP